MPISLDTYATVRTYYGSDDKFPFILVSYWQHTEGTTDPGPLTQDFAVEFKAVVHVAMQNVLCTEAKIYGSHVSFSSGGVIYTASTTGALETGNVLGDEAPDYAACVIRKRTESPGRSGYGRWFVGGVPELFTNTSAITADGQTAYDAFSASLLEDIDTGDDTWVSQHYSGKNHAYYPLISTHVDHWLGTQKRRQVRLPF